MRLQESGEMYLETILILSRTKNYVRSIDVCEYMGYSKPSISRAVGILKGDGYITVEPSGNILLTEKGQAKAEAIYDRHITITAFLHKTLGIDPDTAEAYRMLPGTCDYYACGAHQLQLYADERGILSCLILK